MIKFRTLYGSSKIRFQLQYNSYQHLVFNAVFSKVIEVYFFFFMNAMS